MEQLAAALEPLLQAVDGLGFVARRFHPPHLPVLLERVAPLEAPLAHALNTLGTFPDYLAGVAQQMKLAGDEALAGLTRLRDAAEQGDNIALFRAMRHLPRALEALYPLAGILPPVNRFFLEPAARDDEAMQKRFLRPPAETSGVIHFGEPGMRGGASVYVPEDYAEGTAYPLVMALHGGSGNGRAFLWSWLRAARTHGAIVVAPTAIGPTWSLSGQDVDTPNLVNMLGVVRENWSVDASRMLLTGMSDGGTFAYVSGLEAGSPFTHLAPVSAAFIPLFAEMADAGRVKGLPVHITHGALDWMFALDMPRGAARSLEAAGAAVTYVELEDLSHTYPVEMNGRMLEWVGETAVEPPPSRA